MAEIIHDQFEIAKSTMQNLALAIKQFEADQNQSNKIGLLQALTAAQNEVNVVDLKYLTSSQNESWHIYMRTLENIRNRLKQLHMIS